ncbi:MAG: iron-containing alcohol dehydrogenase [Muribaculaceae bacterium]|nr:iron-containing alcohol dehydrogenase [Muribaculaceae bacterium]
MNNFVFYPATKYVFGRGVENKVAEQLNAFGMKKPLIVYGKGSVVKSGLLDRIRKSLDEAGIAYAELGGVQPNPVDSKVYEGIEIARKEGIDSVLAVGGGSSIDTAKAIAAAMPYDGDFWDFYCGKAKVTKALPVGVGRTIPAAGSEGSGNTVITKLDGLHKLGMGSDVLRPKFALMNPELTFTLPPYQTAAGITDMMAHIMERYFSNTPNVEITDRIAEGVLKAIIAEAPKVIANPEDYDSRANIMWSGTLAHNGVCSGGREEDWATHGLEHELSAVYDVTHGAGLAVMFPAWMTYAMKENPGKLAQFARRVFDIKEENDTEAAALGIDALKRFLTSIGMPVSMKELGIDNPDVVLLAEKVTENKGKVFGNYIKIDKDVAEQIYGIASK